MNYPLRDGVVSYLLKADTKDLVEVFCEQVNNYPKNALLSLMNLLSSHDSTRIITVLGRSRVVLDKDLLKYEFLDDEQYEKGKRLAKLAYTVAFTCYGVPSIYYGDEAGLTGELDPYNRRCFPWGKEDKEMLEHIGFLSKTRQASNALKFGDFSIIYYDKRIIVYERSYESESVVVALSRNESDVKLQFNKRYRDLLGGNIATEFTLKSDGALILSGENQ